jgi:putative aminopeptidase FrvX
VLTATGDTLDTTLDWWETSDRRREARARLASGVAVMPDNVIMSPDAARRAGLTPTIKAIRGGTDGARLTFEGLPCPDIFTGGHNFHGKLEFNSRRGLEKTTETLMNLVQIFAEKAK